MNPVQLLLIRFVVATVSCGATFMFLGGLLYKFEAGFYQDTEVPLPPLDGPHKRARRSFFKALCLVLLVVSLLGLGAHQLMEPVSWSIVGFPAVVGGLFSLLYAGLTRSDKVRPRRLAGEASP